MKDGLSYVTTLMVLGVSFMGINEVLTALVLVVTIGYWVLKTWFLYKRDRREESEWKKKKD